MGSGSSGLAAPPSAATPVSAPRGRPTAHVVVVDGHDVHEGAGGDATLVPAAAASVLLLDAAAAVGGEGDVLRVLAPHAVVRDDLRVDAVVGRRVLPVLVGVPAVLVI